MSKKILLHGHPRVHAADSAAAPGPVPGPLEAVSVAAETAQAGEGLAERSAGSTPWLREPHREPPPGPACTA